MLAYLRRNTVAFAALVIAVVALGSGSAYAINTIRSGDIVDGAVKNQDLAVNSVGSGKIVDNSVQSADVRDGTLTGRDIDESKLGSVPDASRLGGLPASKFAHSTFTVSEPTSSCMGVDIWSSCAGIAIRVPAGHTYSVTVWSSVIAHTGAQAGSAFFCPATTGPSCFDPNPRIGTFWANGYTTAAASDTKLFGPGQYIINTAVKFPMAISVDTYARTTTTVEMYDTALQDLAG
jgi:hypothetical protein